MRQFSIDEPIFRMFPDAQIGVVVLTKLNNRATQESLFHLREIERQTRGRHMDRPLLELPEIDAWRHAYKAMGISKGTHVSVEALLKRVLKGKELPSINPLVDYYNTVSLRFLFPCGGEDLDKVEGDIRLTLAQGTEPFRQIGSEVEEPPEPEEIIYRDAKGAICRRWNWREADRTKLTTETRNAVLVIESLSRSRTRELTEAMNKLAMLGQLKLGAMAQMKILNREHPTMFF